MVRTQIYLTEREQAELRRLAELWGRTQSDLIRDAVDRFIESARGMNRSDVLQSAAGLWRDSSGRPDFTALRIEANRINPDTAQ